MPRASLFGGSWFNDDNAGSRYANLDNWPDNSNDNIGARGRSDDRNSTRRRLWSRRSSTTASRWYRWSALLSCFGEHITRSSRSGRREQFSSSIPGAGIYFQAPMTKRYRNLIEQIVSSENMREAYRLVARGKRMTGGYLDFKEYDGLNLSALAQDMATGLYQAGEPSEFYVFDPKKRLISALPFCDRVAQQALCLIIAPIFDRALLPRTFASRPGKGTHSGVQALQSDLRRLSRQGLVYFLKTDFKQYFASIDRARLWQLIDAKISCAGAIRILEAMIPRSGRGLPIGSLTSQIFANVYTGATLDRHLQQSLGEKYWYRYMDDIVVLGSGSARLQYVKESIEAFSRDSLGLTLSKWQISPASRGINFLGYRIWASHKLLRKDSVTRAKRIIAACRLHNDTARLAKFLPAWLGHASHADSKNLLLHLNWPEAA